MSVAVSHMPFTPAGHFHSAKNSPMMPSINPFAAPFRPSGVIIQPSATGTGVRRLSTGAALAEAVGIDLNAIGKAEAKKIMSIEHKVLGFRPPQGSFAAEAQAAAAKHPEVPGTLLDSEKLTEAAKIDAQRILAERNQSSGSASPTSSAADKGALAPTSGNVPDLDLSTLSEADARLLMSHEHRALGFRPPPGSVAAEAQALVAKTSEVESVTAPKARRMSNDVKPRRGSDESSSSTNWRKPADLAGKPKVRRASNDSNQSKRSSSEEGDIPAFKANSSRRKSLNITGLTALEKEALLREVALRDAERIKATRGINGQTASENAHVEVGDKTATNSPNLHKSSTNLPGPVQEVQETVAALAEPIGPTLDSLTQRVSVTPTGERVSVMAPVDPIPEQEEEEMTRGVMLRTETGDSVEIVGDIVA
ncbi:hypothetical protein BC835DRAFT_1418254 [Cytidiella melzeri]|nr:hypothetical protein BC835DRAFT_1418254 [Cytidiella melzeri]